VMRWSVGLSGIALTLTVAMYLAACSPHGNVEWDGTRVFVHLYFIGLTGIIVVTGSRIHQQLRIKEFALTQELEQSNQKLKELDQLKSRFFANISHELRTPLTLLLAPLETLMGRFRREEETKDLLATMQSNGMRLLKLINDLLDLVRLESGRMEVKL